MRGIVATVVALAVLPSAVQAQAVYRCPDEGGGILYVDAPCKGGVKLDLKPGKADPAAVAKLERAQALDAQRQALRDAQAAESERMREVAWAQPPVVVAPGSQPPTAGDPSWWYWGGWPGYVGAWPGPEGRPPSSRPPAHAAPPVVPARPANPAHIGGR